MNNTATADPLLLAPRTDAEYQGAIQAMLEEMERANARMDQRRAEIERLETQTRTNLNDISYLLTR